MRKYTLVNDSNRDTDFKIDGKWILRGRNEAGEFVQTRLGVLHNNVTQRGRLGGSLQAVAPAYEGVTVHPDFMDAQKFCDWAVAQPGWGYGYSLDKDLLVPGNRQYGPDTCCFLPARINSAIIQPKTAKRSWCREYKNGTFGLAMQWQHLTTTVRGFATAEAVDAEYKARREAFVKTLAVLYRPTISEAAYRALMTWELILPGNFCKKFPQTDRLSTALETA